MTSARWMNLLLWGLGDRLDGTNDYRSDTLMVVDALIWIGIITFLVQEPGLFLVLWVLAPLSGQPIYWVVTQVAIGYIISRSWKKKEVQAPQGARPKVQAPSEPAVSEEP